MNPATYQQPDPKPNDLPYSVDRVCDHLHDRLDESARLLIEDFQARKQLGMERYGTALQPHNGRDVLIDLYQEVLDAIVYCQQGLDEGKEWGTKRDRLIQMAIELKWEAIDGNSR